MENAQNSNGCEHSEANRLGCPECGERWARTVRVQSTAESLGAVLNASKLNTLSIGHQLELLRDALDHIARTCHQSRTQSRRIRWIEARANGALEGKPYDPKLLDLPIQVDREIDRLKRRDDRHLARIKDLEARIAELEQGEPVAVERDADVCLSCFGTGHAHGNGMAMFGTCEHCKGTGEVDL